MIKIDEVIVTVLTATVSVARAAKEIDPHYFVLFFLAVVVTMGVGYLLVAMREM